MIGADAARLPNTANIAVPGTSAETLVIALDLAGVAVSAGAACSSGKVGASHVLEAMGVERELRARRSASAWAGVRRNAISRPSSTAGARAARRANARSPSRDQSEREEQWRQSNRRSTRSERIDVDQYKYGFETDIESVKAPKGLSEDTVRFISDKKGEPAWMLEWRLEAFRRWLTMTEPTWAKVHYPKIDFQNLYYYSAPKSTEGPKSLADVDPELLRTYEKLGIPLKEREILAGVQGARVAVDAVFDSVSVVTTFKDELAKAGVIFCSISEALREHPELVRKYLGSVVPQGDNFYAALNSAVFSDGSFVYVPPGVRCPMELSTYFRINEKETGQFERTLIIADKGAYVSYLEGCTAPMRDENQLHAAVVELIALDDAEIKYSTVQNWYPGDKNGKGGIYNFVTKRGDCRGRNSKISGPRWRRARPSPGSIRAASCAATARGASSIRSPSPTATSRSTAAPR